jgi:P27 family predicted phage terminase small subunit
LVRQVKLTTNPKDRKDQRERTENLITQTKDMSKLQESPPRHLKGIANYVWKRIVPELNRQGWLKQSDKLIVEQLCSQVAIYREAYQHIFVGLPNKKGDCEPEGIQQAIWTAVQSSSGEILEHQFQGYKVNPAVKTMDSAAAKIKSLSETLGMTPSSRAQLLDISDDGKGASLDDLQKMFGS